MNSYAIERNTGITRKFCCIVVHYTHKYRTYLIESISFEIEINKEIQLTSFHTSPCARRG